MCYFSAASSAPGEDYLWGDSAAHVFLAPDCPACLKTEGGCNDRSHRSESTRGRCEVVFDPETSGSVSSLALDPNGGGLTGIACVAIVQQVRTITPTGWDDECSAVDAAGYEAESGISGENGQPSSGASADGSPDQIDLAPTGNSVGAVACPADTQCTAVDGNGNEVTANPQSPGVPASVAIDTSGAGFTAVACPSVTQCTAVDDAGNQVTFNPSRPASPISTRLMQTGAALPGWHVPRSASAPRWTSVATRSPSIRPRTHRRS